MLFKNHHILVNHQNQFNYQLNQSNYYLNQSNYYLNKFNYHSLYYHDFNYHDFNYQDFNYHAKLQYGSQGGHHIFLMIFLQKI